MEKRDSKLEQRLLQALNGARIGKPCYAFREVSSTMERAHALARDGGRRSGDRRHFLASEDCTGSVAGEGTLVFALRQRQGRGRLGRRWESPDGGAYFSLILKPSRPPAESPQLSLVAGLAVAEAIRELTALSPSIRWPNDVLLNGKKVAGILTEGTAGSSVQNYVVVGVGINISTDPRELPETATSLQEASSSTLNAERYTLEPLALVSEVCRKFDGWYDIWTAQGFAPIRESLRSWLSLGEIVRVTASQQLATSNQQPVFEGQATDVDEEGRLLVRMDSGVTRAFDAGEVRLLR